jgi:hypothetical protein
MSCKSDSFQRRNIKLKKIIFKAQRVTGLNVNDYATRKTIAQGMLDLALLTANAAQLKRIMNLGKEYRFYTLLITLITISICLQVVCIFYTTAQRTPTQAI